MTEPGAAFSFLPSQTIRQGPLCLRGDILQLTDSEKEKTAVLEAEFIHHFLQSHRNAGMVIADLRAQNPPAFCGLTIFALVPSTKRGKQTEEREYAVVLLNGGTSQDVQAFLPWLPVRPTVCCLAYLPSEIVAASESQVTNEQLARTIAGSCQHILLSVFDHYGKLFWSFSSTQPFHPEPFLIRDYIPLETPAPMELDGSTRDYFLQKLCDTVWRSWVAAENEQMYDAGRFWCVAPIPPDPFFLSKMGAKFQVGYPKVTNLRVQMARRETFATLADYLQRHHNAFMLAGGQYIWWAESRPLLPGRSADGAFRIVVNTNRRSMRNRENWSISLIFRVIFGGVDTAQCIEHAWEALPGVSCCVIIDAAEDPFAFVRDDRALTMDELEEELRPATSHVVVGGFRNDLPLVWSSVLDSASVHP